MFYSLFIGKNDSRKIREQEKEFNRFPQIWPLSTTPVSSDQTSSSRKRKRTTLSCTSTEHTNEKEVSDNSALVLPHPPYILKDISVCNERFSKLKYPFGTGIRKTPIFTSTVALNSHDWKELACRGILKFCIRGQLESRQEKTLFRFLDCISKLFSESQDVQRLDDLDEEFNEALAEMERDFPVEIQVHIFII